jgi:hypothetical protein
VVDPHCHGFAVEQPFIPAASTCTNRALTNLDLPESRPIRIDAPMLHGDANSYRTRVELKPHTGYNASVNVPADRRAAKRPASATWRYNARHYASPGIGPQVTPPSFNSVLIPIAYNKRINPAARHGRTIRPSVVTWRYNVWLIASPRIGSQVAASSPSDITPSRRRAFAIPNALAADPVGATRRNHPIPSRRLRLPTISEGRPQPAVAGPYRTRTATGYGHRKACVALWQRACVNGQEPRLVSTYCAYAT